MTGSLVYILVFWWGNSKLPIFLPVDQVKCWFLDFFVEMLGVAQILGYSLYDRQTCFETHWLSALPFQKLYSERKFYSEKKLYTGEKTLNWRKNFILEKKLYTREKKLYQRKNFIPEKKNYTREKTLYQRKKIYWRKNFIKEKKNPLFFYYWNLGSRIFLSFGRLFNVDLPQNYNRTKE